MLAAMSSLGRTFNLAPATRAGDLRTALAMFGMRGWLAAVIGASATLLLIGMVASLIENPVFDRQLAARPQDYVIWALTAILGGLIAGTFAVSPTVTNQGKAASGGVLSAIAVGCPICNKVAVTLLGTSGALNTFGPTQIFIGIGSLILLTWTLSLRAQAVVGSCPMDVGAGAAPRPGRP